MPSTDTQFQYDERLRAIYVPVSRTYLLIAGAACFVVVAFYGLISRADHASWISLAYIGAGATGLAGWALLTDRRASLQRQVTAVVLFNLALTCAVSARLIFGESQMAAMDFIILSLVFALAGPTTTASVLSALAATLGSCLALSFLPPWLRPAYAVSEAPVCLAAVAGGLLRHHVMRNVALDHVRIAALNVSLEAERANSLALAVQARRASEAKSAFLSNMSHDLRTPLNGVSATMGVLTRTRLTRRQREMCDLIEASTRTVTGLVADLFDVAQIETGALDLKAEPFDLAACLNETAASARGSALDKGLELRIDIDLPAACYVDSDAVRLRQVVMNLLSNAIKFTESGEIHLTAVAYPTDDHARLPVEIVVADTGIGIDPMEASRLFQPFEQGAQRRQGGSGLGLAIVKSIVDRMGGRVAVEGAKGQGSTFRLSFEFTRTGQTGDAPKLPEDDGRLRILAADDHPTNRKVIELMLTPTAKSLTLVEDGRAAVDAWLSTDFDVVLMDMQMPVMDGLEAIRLIRMLERQTLRPRTPIAMLSAATMPENVAAAISAGADLHMSKPITPTVLAAGLRRTISLAQAQEDTDTHSNFGSAPGPIG